MSNDLYNEKLNWFKRNEKPEAVLLVADNPDLVKKIFVWTSLDTKRIDILAELPNDSENEIWKWLWENTTYSLQELKEKIGTSLSEIALENKMKSLVGNRIIYPDGTVNSFVERYLREKVIKLFEVKPKKPLKRA